MGLLRFLWYTFLILLWGFIAITVAGCATVDLQCGMRADYKTQMTVSRSGKVSIAWVYGAGFEGHQYGEMIDADDVKIIRMTGEPPDFNNICDLARLGHEVAHAMGGRHQ